MSDRDAIKALRLLQLTLELLEKWKEYIMVNDVEQGSLAEKLAIVAKKMQRVLLHPNPSCLCNL